MARETDDDIELENLTDGRHGEQSIDYDLEYLLRRR